MPLYGSNFFLSSDRRQEISDNAPDQTLQVHQHLDIHSLHHAPNMNNDGQFMGESQALKQR